MNHRKQPFIFDDLPDDALIRLRQLMEHHLVPFSPTTTWRKCRQGEFPQPIKVSPGITAWRVRDIRKYLEKLGARSGKEAASKNAPSPVDLSAMQAELKAAESETEIIKLVRSLHTKRTKLAKA
jgi:prophage regulatory protein